MKSFEELVSTINFRTIACAVLHTSCLSQLVIVSINCSRNGQLGAENASEPLSIVSLFPSLNDRFLERLMLGVLD